jgi:hypothetical protein
MDGFIWANGVEPPDWGADRWTMRWRLLASLSALCALSGLLAACGAKQASGPAPGAATRVKPASTRRAHRRITRAQALTFARAVNLTAADVPEARASRKKERAEDPRERRELERCEPPHYGHPLAELDSPKLTRGEQLETEEIRSYVGVAPSGRRADRTLALFASGAVRACIARALSRAFARRNVRGARWGRVSVSALSAPAPGADAGVGVRISVALSIEYAEVSVPLYVDVVGFALGPAEVAMSAMSITQPLPAATEHELLALLLARAKAHPL